MGESLLNKVIIIVIIYHYWKVSLGFDYLIAHSTWGDLWLMCTILKQLLPAKLPECDVPKQILSHNQR